MMTHQVTMSVTDSQIKITPSSIPPGAASIKVTNTGKSAKSIVFSGGGMNPESKDIKPGETTTLSTSMLKPGTYSVVVPAPKSGGKAISSKLIVGAPTPMPHPMNSGKPMSGKPMPGKPGGNMPPHSMPGGMPHPMPGGMPHAPTAPPPAPK
jgi:hypothetical protein